MDTVALMVLRLVGNHTSLHKHICWVTDSRGLVVSVDRCALASLVTTDKKNSPPLDLCRRSKLSLPGGVALRINVATVVT